MAEITATSHDGQRCFLVHFRKVWPPEGIDPVENVHVHLPLLGFSPAAIHLRLQRAAGAAALAGDGTNGQPSHGRCGALREPGLKSKGFSQTVSSQEGSFLSASVYSYVR